MFVFSVLLHLASCDNTDGPTNVLHQDPTVTDLQVSPAELDFNEDDGVRDTLITFQISARSELPDNFFLIGVLASTADREQIDTDTLSLTDTDRYSGTLSTELHTTDQKNLVLYVYAAGPETGVSNRVESVIKVRGTSAGFPIVLNVDHPDEVLIPPPGESTMFNITSDVSHSVFLTLIDRVWLELIDKDNRLIYRDNMDETASDSEDYRRFTEGFSLDSGNSPDSITVQVYAVDTGGTHSDTLRSHFIITR